MHTLSLFVQEEVEYARVKQPWGKNGANSFNSPAETRNYQSTILHFTDLTIMRKDSTQKLPLVKIHSLLA